MEPHDRRDGEKDSDHEESGKQPQSAATVEVSEGDSSLPRVLLDEQRRDQKAGQDEEEARRLGTRSRGTRSCDVRRRTRSRSRERRLGQVGTRVPRTRDAGAAGKAQTVVRWHVRHLPLGGTRRRLVIRARRRARDRRTRARTRQGSRARRDGALPGGASPRRLRRPRLLRPARGGRAARRRAHL